MLYWMYSIYFLDCFNNSMPWVVISWNHCVPTP
jgi:hypothetical protein